MAEYYQTLTTLFALLAQANLADSDEYAQDWQTPADAGYTGYYGCLHEAIFKIAGNPILEHWAETNEVDLTLALRMV